MKFEMTFHSPFRVASGRAGDGANSTIDRATPLPASTLKGLMRSAARDLLGVPEEWVRMVFGSDHVPSPWSWSDAKVLDPGDLTVRVRARIQVDDDTATAVEGALAIADEVLAHRAEFSVTRSGWIPDHTQLHQDILVAAARAVTAVGGDRRRGLGWVAVTPVDPPWSSDMVNRLVATLFALPPASSPPVPSLSGEEVPR